MFTVDIQFTLCGVSTVVGMTMQNICIIPMFTLEKAGVFLLLNITFVRLQSNIVFE